MASFPRKIKKLGQANKTRLIIDLIIVLIIIFLLSPEIVVVMAGLNAGTFLTFPPQGFSLKWIQLFLSHREFIGALILSLKVAVIVTLLSTVLGLTTSFVIVRQLDKYQSLVNAIFLSPLILPAILTGLSLLIFLSLIGVGITFEGLVLGHILVTLPYTIRTISAMLYVFDVSLEEAARSLGASGLRAFYEVTFPLIKPGIVAGAIFAFTVSVNQFTVSIFLVSGGEITLPIQIFNWVRYSFDPTAAAASTFFILSAIIAMVAIDKTIGLENFAGFG